MGEEPRSATQIFRAVQEGQAQEHVARIQQLEAQVARLEDELGQLRRGGGTEELRDLPQEALQALLRVFEAVPIPDLSAWEQRQALQRLGGLLGGLEQEGSLPAGTWDAGAQRLLVQEGDGAAVARVTRQILATLAEVAGRYLAQMIEYQGTTPDHVSRARASSLMDASSQQDAKAQFGLLPPDHQRQLFDDQVEQLIQAKDQLHTITRWLSEASARVRDLLGRQGRSAPRDASLLGLLELLADPATEPAPSRQAALHQRLERYAALLPAPELLETLELTDTPWQRTFRQGASPEAPCALLADALEAVLADHERILLVLKPQAVTARERKALARLAKAPAGSPARARAVLEGLRQRLQAVEEVEARQAEAQKQLVKRFAAPLDREARARIAAHERPEQAAAAFERLSKPETTAHLASLWLELVEELQAQLGEGLASSQAQAREAALAAVGSAEPARLRERRRALEALLAALREPPEPEDPLSLTPAIDVEAGLLARQEQELQARVAELLGKYSQAKKAGCQSLEQAAGTLAAIAALSSGKKAALDAVLKKAHRGSCSPKREAAAAAALLEERRDVEAGEERLRARKQRALLAAQAQLQRAGLGGLPDFDAVWARATQELAGLGAAQDHLDEVGRREARAVELAGRLIPGEVVSAADARAVLAQSRDDARRLRALGQELEAAREAYLEEARGLLRTRKSAADFGVARDTAEAVGRELALVDGLREARQSYLASFKQAGGPGELGKLLTWVRRERKKAAELGIKVRAGETQLERALDKLAELG